VGIIIIPSMAEGAGPRDTTAQRILYSKLSNQCRKCRKFGHLAKICPLNRSPMQSGSILAKPHSEWKRKKEQRENPSTQRWNTDKIRRRESQQGNEGIRLVKTIPNKVGSTDRNPHYPKNPQHTISKNLTVAPLLWPSVGVKPNTWKSWDLESFGTPECSKLHNKWQNTSHWGVLGVFRKVLKRKYRKCPRIGNSDICSPSYGQKKGRESNWQFDSRSLKVENRPLLMSDSKVRHGVEKIWTRAITLVETLLRSNFAVESYGSSKFQESRWDKFGTPIRESWKFVPFGCPLCGELQRIL
jgi:hypothetical protein